MIRKYANNRMQKKPNNFGQEYGNQKKITKGQMDNQYDKRFRKTRRKSESGCTHRFIQDNTKIYENGNRPAMMEEMDSGSRNSPPVTTD